ncbi:hypothetical protein AVEN_26398-1, partial [Araneus ventricosus]
MESYQNACIVDFKILCSQAFRNDTQSPETEGMFINTDGVFSAFSRGKTPCAPTRTTQG